MNSNRQTTNVGPSTCGKRCARAAMYFALLASIGGLVGGCGGGNGRQAVDGTVTLDSAPLATGLINLRPAAGGHGNSAGAAVVDGKFTIAVADGLLPGDYEINVQAFRKTGRTVNDPQLGAIDETEPVKLVALDPAIATISADGVNRMTIAATSK